jgi:hypothetical protein
MKFAMLICGDDAEWTELPPAEEEALMTQVYGWFERWQPAGKVAEGGVELQPRQTARTIRKGTDGGVVVTDGPYLELKEVIGSVLILEADSMEEAVEVASSWPIAAGMTAIEVRPVLVRE